LPILLIDSGEMQKIIIPQRIASNNLVDLLFKDLTIIFNDFLSL